MIHRDYLSGIERASKGAAPEKYEIFAKSAEHISAPYPRDIKRISKPGTPEEKVEVIGKTTSFQDFMRFKMGASDEDTTNPDSRTCMILKYMEGRNIRHVLDIGCGDGAILTEIRKVYPRIKLYATDLHADEFTTHMRMRDDGIFLYRAYMQIMFETRCPAPFDLVLFMNMFHGFNEKTCALDPNLPAAALEWFRSSSYHTVLTAELDRIEQMRKYFQVTVLGHGERGRQPGEEPTQMVALEST